MTSLQRVSRTGKLEAKSGAFESSFAAGLDLSDGRLLEMTTTMREKKKTQEEQLLLL
jgi:hypothetical protein